MTDATIYTCMIHRPLQRKPSISKVRLGNRGLEAALEMLADHEDDFEAIDFYDETGRLVARVCCNVSGTLH